MKQPCQVLDSQSVLKDHKDVRLYSVMIYGSNYVEAIKLEHSVSDVSNGFGSEMGGKFGVQGF